MVFFLEKKKRYVKDYLKRKAKEKESFYSKRVFVTDTECNSRDQIYRQVPIENFR